MSWTQQFDTCMHSLRLAQTLRLMSAATHPLRLLFAVHSAATLGPLGGRTRTGLQHRAAGQLPRLNTLHGCSVASCNTETAWLPMVYSAYVCNLCMQSTLSGPPPRRRQKRRPPHQQRHHLLPQCHQ
jgi:ABC-type uncharacterized transport system permease subunit